MPFSSNVFDDFMRQLIGALQPTTACDIGPGTGKYGHMIRDAAKGQFVTTTTAIEIDPSYVETYQLRDLYDTVIVDDCVSLILQPRVRFDLVIIGDCIEHLLKSRGIDLLNFLIYRTGYIVVIYPEAYVQDDWEGHAAEAHISTWSPKDFEPWPTIHRHAEGMHLFVVKGYQPTRVTLT